MFSTSFLEELQQLVHPHAWSKKNTEWDFICVVCFLLNSVKLELPFSQVLSEEKSGARFTWNAVVVHASMSYAGLPWDSWNLCRPHSASAVMKPATKRLRAQRFSAHSLSLSLSLSVLHLCVSLSCILSFYQSLSVRHHPPLWQTAAQPRLLSANSVSLLVFEVKRYYTLKPLSTHYHSWFSIMHFKNQMVEIHRSSKRTWPNWINSSVLFLFSFAFCFW